jgi:NADH-quinone oxidoreductase subunit C
MAEKRFEEALRGLETGPVATPAGEGMPRGGTSGEPGHPSVAALRGRFGAAVLHHVVMAGDENVVYVPAESVREILGWLKNEPSQHYDFLADLTAVDYGGGRPLEVVYQLWSIEHKRALRVKATLPLDRLEIDSMVQLWQTANWLEREVFDLFGIHFGGHPDLRRILMPERYAEGHPLRKDFPLRGRFSRAEQTRRALAMAVEDYYNPEELRIAEEEAHAEMPAATSEAVPSAPGLHEVAVEAAEDAPHKPRPNRPEEWALGAPESAASGAPAPPGPEGAKE